nr:SelB C-terminal domain-containing protein [Campylobacteraceae bacterium]
QNLKKSLFSLNQKTQKSSNEKDDIFRYYIDRVFNIKGAGVVVTGTLLSGQVKVGEKVWIAQSQKQTQIKSIQIHESPSEVAYKNQRVALNLSGVKAGELKKGMLLTQKGYIRGFENVDLYLTCKSDYAIPHNANVALHLGAEKIQGKLLHLQNNDNFQEGFSTFVGSEKIFCVFDDKCIISYKGEVVAGGFVVNPINDPIKKRHKLPILEALRDKNFKKAFLLLSSCHKRGFGLISAYQRFGLSHERALEFINSLSEVFVDEKALLSYPKEMIEKTQEIILNIYKKNPYALISQKSLNLKYKWVSEHLALKALQELQKQDKILHVNGVFCLQGINPKELEQNTENKIFSILKDGDISPLAPYNIYDELDIDRKAGDNALKALTKSKKVVRLEHNFFITSEVLSRVINLCRQIIKNEGFVDIKSLKEKLNLSRKYLIAYLEYLDKFEDIDKIDNKRVIKK